MANKVVKYWSVCVVDGHQHLSLNLPQCFRLSGGSNLQVAGRGSLVAAHCFTNTESILNIHTYIHTYTFIALPEKGFSAAIFKYILKILHELKIEKI